MRSERLARALLRLYPRDWRERYGDELLALVSESGLTWRAAADITVVATTERVRRLFMLARAEMEATEPLPPVTPAPASEFLLTHLGFVGLVAGSIYTCTYFGMPSPEWILWLQLLTSSLGHFDSDYRVTRATIGERVVLSFAWFLVGMWITVVGWLIGDGVRQLGVPEPSDGLFLLMIASLVVLGVLRMLYRGMASALNHPRPDITRREMCGWSAALFVMSILFGAADPRGQAIWTTGYLWTMWLRFARIHRVRSARSRQLREQRGF